MSDSPKDVDNETFDTDFVDSVGAQANELTYDDQVHHTESDQQPSVESVENHDKISKVKLGFLYLLIGGLVVAALISVVALLIGTISQSIQSAFLTTGAIVLYSAMLLLVVLADTRNQLGRSLLPTAIFILLICQMVTSVLGIWDILPEGMAGRFTALYCVALSGAFLVEGMLRLSLNHKVVKTLSYASSGAVVLFVVILSPWIILSEKNEFGDLYYRIVAAVSIVIVTMLIVTAIMNRITVYQRPETRLASGQAMAPGLVAIVATVGSFVGLFMLFGIAVFVVAATSVA